MFPSGRSRGGGLPYPCSAPLRWRLGASSVPERLALLPLYPEGLTSIGEEAGDPGSTIDLKEGSNFPGCTCGQC